VVELGRVDVNGLRVVVIGVEAFVVVFIVVVVLIVVGTFVVGIGVVVSVVKVFIVDVFLTSSVSLEEEETVVKIVVGIVGTAVVVLMALALLELFVGVEESPEELLDDAPEYTNSTFLSLSLSLSLSL